MSHVLSNFFAARYLAPLEGFAGFVTSGADVNSFLQGQLTNDVAGLQQGQSQRTGYCTPKGRLLATMLQWRIDPQALGQLLPAELLESTVKRLRMYVLRSKVSFSAAESPLAALGLWGEWTASGLDGLAGNPSRGVIRLAGNASGAEASNLISADALWLIAESACPVLGARAWLVGSPQAIADCANQLGQATVLPQTAWQFSEIQNAKPWIYKATQEAFVPQMINFELIGGVSFTKGCYPGQEVVARSQYLGKLKRRCFRVNLEAMPAGLHDASGLVGQDVWSASNTTEACGRIVSAAPIFNEEAQMQPGIALLIESSLEAWEASRLHALSVDGPPLIASTLPYALA